MKYLDTGSRDPDQALAKWLQELDPTEVAELRIQSGFFGLGGIGLLLPILEKHANEDRTTKILIGSNQGSTLRDDVLGLASYMEIPRKGAQLGVVIFGNAYFHPKTYHVTRADGSQAAYVGSANLSSAGLSLHVEAGITLDTRDGDMEIHLSEIAHAIDAWFNENRDGLNLIEDIESIEALVANKVLALAPSPKPKPASEAKSSAAGGSSSKPKLKPIVGLPPVKTVSGTPADEPDEDDAPEIEGATSDSGSIAPVSAGDISPAPPAPSTPPVTGTSASAFVAGETPPPTFAPAAVLPSVPKIGFPQYFLFDPTASQPTIGNNALTGTTLPSGASGLIIQLNLDSARHFMGGVGTANISIPVATVGTLRFGIYGLHSRPRAEFSLEYRFVTDKNIVAGGTANTNIMGYGYTATESGHADIRMLVPANMRGFGEILRKAGLKVPTNGDFALLEWPKAANPVFRLTFLEGGSTRANQASGTFASAIKAGQVVGQGACWLPAGLSPAW